jgi:hypothetical protein
VISSHSSILIKQVILYSNVSCMFNYLSCYDYNFSFDDVKHDVRLIMVVWFMTCLL